MLHVFVPALQELVTLPVDVQRTAKAPFTQPFAIHKGGGAEEMCGDDSPTPYSWHATNVFWSMPSHSSWSRGAVSLKLVGMVLCASVWLYQCMQSVVGKGGF